MKKYIGLFALICGFGMLTSCLDEDPLFDPDKSENIIEFYDINAIASPAGAIYPLYVSSFPVSQGAEFPVIISYSGAHENNEDITVTVALSPTALAEYNEEQHTHYEVLPDALFSVPSYTVTIPKGQTKANLVFTVKTADFDFAKAYAIPLKIVSSSKGTISGNFSTAIYAVGAKNRYDGIYRIETGSTMVDVTNGAFTGIYPKTVELRTVDATSVNYYDLDYALAGHVFNTGGGASYYGGFLAKFFFDDNGNVVNVTNNFGQGNNNRSGKLDPTGINKMTFAADGQTPVKLEVKYIMRQINTGVDRTTWTETYTYLGPR
jgi:hypothetical protein